MTAGAHDPTQQASGHRQRGWRFYVATAAAVLALIFVLQNTDETNITFLFATAELPLFFALIIAIGLGALIGWLTPRVRRTDRDR
jgi:uncharacterized integral membrane protein